MVFKNDSGYHDINKGYAFTLTMEIIFKTNFRSSLNGVLFLILSASLHYDSLSFSNQTKYLRRLINLV